MIPGEKAKGFVKLLRAVDIERICTGYPANYLQHLIGNIEYYTAVYVKVLAGVMDKTYKDHTSIRLVDYGCGNGLLGLFALHCGFKQVIFVDTNNEFLGAAKQLASRLDFTGGRFVCGEIDKLYNEQPRIDAVAGTDVIEHIYDPDSFFTHIFALNPNMVTVFTTAANPFNPILKRRLRKLHLKDEFVGNEGAGISGKAHPPFLQLRKQLIEDRFPELKNAEQLATATRGLAGAHLYEAVEKYQLTNNFPTPAEGSNTCDPVTGSWTERLMPAGWYINLYKRHGFRAEISAGFYNEFKKGFEKWPAKALNLLIKVLGKTFSPFIIITGFKK